MKVISGRNVHNIFPIALKELFENGIHMPSRNGPVLQSPQAVTTHYSSPCERVIFWPERDANPFFHLYEALWMLRGRCDVSGVAKYASNMVNFSDDGKTYHGAYGYRWRRHFDLPRTPGFIEGPTDQLGIIAKQLRKDPTDRRCVLQMWDAEVDLGREGKDFPCNTIATFQIGTDGKLNLHVFCRSNDIVWGCYGANAVQFSFLLEYMAHWLHVPVGVYEQISVNWHGYLSTTEKVRGIIGQPNSSPYEDYSVRFLPLATPEISIEEVNYAIDTLLFIADRDFALFPEPKIFDQPFFDMAYYVLKAYAVHKRGNTGEALRTLKIADQSVDWVVAATEWLERRNK